jgi:D-alanyl-D-alanine dipeptidase
MLLAGVPTIRFLPLVAAGVLACSPAPRSAADDDRATVANATEQEVADSSVARALLAELDGAIGQEVRYATSDNFTGQPLPGYERGVVLLRREAAAALGRVASGLAGRGLGLKVWDGYRPVRATLAMVDWTERVGRTDLLDDGYIARRSRHNQGVAVDLTLVELATGAELDMGTPYDSFTEAAHTASASGVVAANRRVLVEAMAAEGFTNYVNEWWHFSYEVPDPTPFDLPLGAW